MIITDLFHFLISYKNLTYYLRYLAQVSLIRNGKSRFSAPRLEFFLLYTGCLYHTFHLLYIYFFCHYSFDSVAIQRFRFIHGDIEGLLTGSRVLFPLSLLCSLISAIFLPALYLIDPRLSNMSKELLFGELRSSELKRFTLRLLTVFQMFIPVLDGVIIYFHYAFASHALIIYNTSGFESLWLAIALNLFHALLLDLNFIVYTHCCILSSTLVLSYVRFLNVRFRENLHRLRRVLRWAVACRTSTSGLIATFIRQDLQSFKYFFACKEGWAQFLAVFILLNCPLHAYLTMLTCLGRIGEPGGNWAISIIVYGAIVQETIALIGIHLYEAQFPGIAHASARPLASLAARIQNPKNSKLRSKIQLALTLFRLHVTKKYGFTYGPAGLITLGTFTKCLLLYGKFLIFSYKLIQTH